MEETIVTSSKKIKEVFNSHVNRRRGSYYTESTVNETISRLQEDNNFSNWNVKNDEVDESSITKPNNNEPIIPIKYGGITPINNNRENINYEDSESILDNIFRGRDFIPSESWVSNEIIKARIVSSDNDSVYLDCIIDLETMYFELRQFHKSLFSNFKTLETGDLALIKLKSKPGSFRVDVYPGEGLVNANLFEIKDDIQRLKGRSLGTKLREW
ncbi:hypothetical protein [Galbibacter sp.]|uniref:hypothetical protein n=1 Tax=Galbibacter sp. TaxID=2918471 RepID=UPI003A90CD37